MGRSVSVVIVAWVLAVAACEDPALDLDGDPGRVTARRLNRAEYDNTVAELLGTRLAPARDFPSDDRAFGWDNVADQLTLSSAHVELFEQATWLLVDEAFAARDAGDAGIRARLFVCEPAADDPGPCVREIVAHFVPRAWRRPIDAASEDRLVAQFEAARSAGASVDDALRAVIATVLLSPQFLFRIERDVGDDEVRALDDWEVASRLSYFLWSSMPDDELFAAAADGRLRDRDGVVDQVERMLADPRAEALVEDFAGQWLAIRGIDDMLKDAYRYPEYDDALGASMRAELTTMFATLVAEHRPIQELLVTDRGHVDARLAAFYGVTGGVADGMTEIEWGELPRGGLLTSAGWLSVHAYPFTTSPARRGRFVLEQLLCRPMGSPPAGIVMSAPSSQSGKLENSAARLSDPACAGCHAQMDPIGFAFEPYDAIGVHRITEGEEPIARGGTLPDGRTFADAQALAELIADDPAFPRCAVQQTLAYALGRKLGPHDVQWIDALTEALEASDFDTAALFAIVAGSTPFRYRTQGEP